MGTYVQPEQLSQRGFLYSMPEQLTESVPVIKDVRQNRELVTFLAAEQFVYSCQQLIFG